MITYRLDQEPWIPVKLTNGTQTEVSLSEVFRQAQEIRAIAGNPPEVAVLHRLLLAIFQRAVPLQGDDPWEEAYQQPANPLGVAAEYVTRLGPTCFDLFHPENPFMQHPRLAPGDKPMAVILYDRAAGNNPVFLDASQEAGATSIPSGIAARALLVNMAFGGSHPDKSNPLSSGKENTMYAGPLCARMVVIVEGQNLAQNLLLNSLVEEKVGTAAWERQMAEHPKKSKAEGIADRYTRTTRFVRLRPSHDGRHCLSVALHMGEQIEESDEPDDPMMPLYVAKDGKFKVQRLDPERALWRSSHVLFNAQADPKNGRPARALAQLRRLASTGLIPSDQAVGLRVVGVAGNAQGPTTELWRDEVLPFSLSLVQDDAAYARLEQAVKLAHDAEEKLRKRIYRFAARYLQAAIPNPDPKDVARLAESLDPGHHRFWSALAPEGEKLGLAKIDPEKWQETVNAASNRAYEQAVNRIPVSGRRLQAQYLKDSTASSTKSKKASVKTPS